MDNLRTAYVYLGGSMSGLTLAQSKGGRVAHECAEGVWLTWPDGERVAVDLRPACDPGAEALLIERCPHYTDHGEEP